MSRGLVAVHFVTLSHQGRGEGIFRLVGSC